MSFSAIGSALYSRLGTVSYTYNVGGTVTVSGTLGLYDTLAPQGGTLPYVIVQRQTSDDQYLFGDEHGEEATYIVKAVSNRLYASQQAFAIYEQAHAALQDAPLSVSGHKVLFCRRMSTTQYQDSKSYWHVGGVYRIFVWET